MAALPVAQHDADPDRFDTVIEANQDAQGAAGHWGVPTMLFEEEPLFGQDRFSHLVWRLEQKGLENRA